MTRRELVEQLLQDAGPSGVTTSAFLRAGAGSRFGARVQELRDAGSHITCTRVREGEFLYCLEQSEPQSWVWDFRLKQQRDWGWFQVPSSQINRPMSTLLASYWRGEQVEKLAA